MNRYCILTTSLAWVCVIGFSYGCVKPDPDNPWSTKSKSAGGKQAPNTGHEHAASSSAAEASPSRAVDFEEETIRVRPSDEAPMLGNAGGVASENAFALAEIRAQSILMRAANDQHPLLRANGFEGLEYVPHALAELAPMGLSDENRAVRFVTAMAVGNASIQGMAPYIEPLLLDDSESVQAAGIFALRSLGEPVDPSPLAAFVMSEDPEVRANTYLILGKLANPSAIPLIQSSLGTGMHLANPMRVKIAELQAADALVELGERAEVEPIRAALFAPVEQGELTILACQLLGQIGDGQARSMLQRLLTAPGRQQRPLEIRIAAAKALFMIDEMPSEQLAGVIFSGVGNEDARVRVQAASALAVVPGKEAQRVLIGMLEDTDPLVSTAAAAAIARRSHGSMDQ